MIFGLKAHDILVAWPGIKPANPCIGRCTLNHWIAGQVPYINYFWFTPAKKCL